MSIYSAKLYLIAALIFVVFLMLLIMIFIFFRLLRSNRSQIKSIRATVINKMGQHDLIQFGNTYNSLTTSNKYFIVFQLRTGERLMLSVSQEEYATLLEYEVGILKYKGKKFLDFIRD